MAIRPAKKTTVRPKLARTYLERQLDASHDKLGHDLTLSQDDRDMMAFAQVAARAALDWCPDPLHATFPPQYAADGARLPGVCTFLRKAETEMTPDEVKAARDKYVAALRRAWPEYAATCADLSHDQASERSEWHYTWAGINSLWADEEPGPGMAKLPAPKLPAFSVPISETWHCLVVTVTHLNRLTNRPLADFALP